jgi:predicted nucleic acid-binding protein
MKKVFIDTGAWYALKNTKDAYHQEVEHHTRALEIFTKYSDQDFSYTDCTSFIIMESLKIKEVLAFDRHFTFEKFGFKQIRFSKQI